MPPMLIIAPWYRREDYERLRKMMDDLDHLPEGFDEWAQLADSQLAQAAAQGMVAEKVIIDPDGFAAFKLRTGVKGDPQGRMQYAHDVLRRQQAGHG